MTNARVYKYQFEALGGSNELQLVGEDPREADRVAEVLKAEVARIEQKFSRYRADSVVSQINSRAGSGQLFEVDSESAGLIGFAANAYAESNGLFDITSGILRKIWNCRRTAPPSEGELAECQAKIGWEKVQWTGSSIALPIAGMEIDFGGVGKEYAVDRVVGIALAAGVCGGIVNLGGDVRVFGVNPTHPHWSVGVRDPLNLDRPIGSITLGQGSVATSGDYERKLEIAGRCYSHILNPKTGWPVTGFRSVSVVAESCLLAGFFTTTAILLGETRGRRFLKDSNLPYLTVSAKGEVAYFPRSSWQVVR